MDRNAATALTLAASFAMFGAVRPAFAACDQTVGPGEDLPSLVAAAETDSTICLRQGNYGVVSFVDLARRGGVTIESRSGRSASAFFIIHQSSYIKLRNLTITGLEIDTNERGGTKNITVSANTFTGQAVINTGNNRDANILIDGNTFDNITVCANCYEGRLQIVANPWVGEPSGVTISNNRFGNGGDSDGVQTGAYGVVIGPGNIFENIQQGTHRRHVDAIQGYGQSHTVITGNLFRNNDIFLMFPDGGNSERITNNVFENREPSFSIQLGSHANSRFTHNTVINAVVSIDKKTDSPKASRTVIVRDNVMIGSQFKTTDSNRVESCKGCVFDNNLFAREGDARGTNASIGTPIFAGGAHPTTWQGFQLLRGSPGHAEATDGRNIGVNCGCSPE